MNFLKLFVLIAVVVLTGCSARGPLFQEVKISQQDDALIYIYRTDSFAFGGRDTYFYINDVNIADLSNNGYTWFYLPEGEYTLKQKWPADLFAKDIEIPFAVKRGETIFYRFDTGLCGGAFLCINWRLEQIMEEHALVEIKTSRMQAAFGMNKLNQKLDKNKADK